MKKEDFLKEIHLENEKEHFTQWVLNMEAYLKTEKGKMEYNLINEEEKRHERKLQL